MIKEEYVSFETAKLLKEKGFDVFGDGSYGTETEVHREYSPFGKIRDISASRPSQKGYPAPTQQMAMRWLREEKNIGVFPATYTITNVEGMDVHYTYGTAIVNLITHDLMLSDFLPKDTYEDAIEVALRYCLENFIS